MKTISALLITAVSIAAQSVFTCDFESDSLGVYSVERVKSVWNTTWENGVSEGRAEVVDDGGNKVLRIFYPKDSVGVGAKWEMNLETPYDTLWVQYRLKFDSSFTFVRGGKLPGLGGGTTPTGGEPCTGEEGFSARIMWRWKPTADGDQGAMCQYVYHMDMAGVYGDDLFWAYPNYTWSSTRRYFVPGQWHTVKSRIIINTPGEQDGRITSWLDGDLGLDSLMRFRAAGITHFGVDKFLFSTFFGGSDSTWAPEKDEHIYFDDFVISTRDPDEGVVAVESNAGSVGNRSRDIAIVQNRIQLEQGHDYDQLTLYSLAGKVLYWAPLLGKTSLAIPDLAPGVVVVDLRGDSGALRVPVIVQ